MMFKTLLSLSPAWLCTIWSRIVWVIIYSQTVAARFWFGFASIGFGVFIANSVNIHSKGSEFYLLTKIASDFVWSGAFFIHGFSVWYGIFTKTYSRLLLVLEGLLGVIVWSASAVAVVLEQRSFGAQMVGAFIAFWLLVRYPTHWEYHDAD